MPVSIVMTHETASSALAAPMQWPIMLLTLEIGTRRSPKTSRMTLASAWSLARVPVPCALTKSTWSGPMPECSSAWRIAAMLPVASGCGRVMW